MCMTSGGAQTLLAMLVVPFNIQKCSSSMSLEAPSYPLPYGTVCVGIGSLVYRHQAFFTIIFFKKITV